ncbi:hypothetical protein O9929_11665 [Vibrio lentus]|nr:hypothetical protein [Vibrio lentus]
MGERLKQLVDETCMIGRFGGDEFIVIPIIAETTTSRYFARVLSMP